jgi:hypothetical protein
MSEPTRIIQDQKLAIPRSSVPSRHRSDLQFFRADLTPGREGVAGPDPEAGQRFASEIHYANFYARKLGDTLAMERLEMAVVEDRDFQTGFAFSPTDGRWHGFIASHRLSLEDARTELSQR